MHKYNVIIPLILFVLISSSCLEHQYNIKVNPDGSVDYTLSISGDSADLYDGLTSLPSGPIWKIDKSIKIDSSREKIDTIFIYKAEAKFPPSAELPANFASGDSILIKTGLNHPLSIRRQNLFFLVNYFLEFSFLTRDKTALYGDPQKFIPDECKALDTGEELSDSLRKSLEDKAKSGYLKWGLELYQGWFRSALKQTLKAHSEIQIDSVKLQDFEKTTEPILMDKLNKMDLNEEKVEVKIWAEVYDKMLKQFQNAFPAISDSAFFQHLKEQTDLNCRRYAVTDDLMDESFVVQASLPGVTRSSNADTLINGQLEWKFKGEDFADSTLVLSAVATIYHYEFIYPAAGLLIVLIVLFLRWIFIQRKRDA